MVYELSHDAEKDLKEIVRYTMDKWGNDATDTYVSGLIEEFVAIGKGDAVKQRYNSKFPDLYMTMYRLHMIYYEIREGKEPLIVRILHGKQDRVRHLEKVLSKSQ